MTEQTAEGAEVRPETPEALWPKALKNPKEAFATPEKTFRLVEERKNSSGKTITIIRPKRAFGIGPRLPSRPETENLGPNESFWEHLLLRAENGEENIANIDDLVWTLLRAKDEGLISGFDFGRSFFRDASWPKPGTEYENTVAIFFTPLRDRFETEKQLGRLSEETIRTRKQQSSKTEGKPRWGVIGKLLGK